MLFEVGSNEPEAAAPGEFHHLNHLGVEAQTADEVLAAETRLAAPGLETIGVDDTRCCFAEKTETWVDSP